ncbi:hypothetical protein TanjilG_14478 [Lupinus angustifolius]|uniref:Uncharacterized protein n=1 Tax=Lupinus angustifolius TaxID=3871 RepID=A0A1J7H4J4_LUPAN|nr:hypothetical protein TanjilG_14478 [Lupinus angustifolius]
MTTNLVNNLKDRFNQGNVAAANNVTTWSGTCYITPLIGAFIADAYLGRYWTIASFSIIYVITNSMKRMTKRKKKSFFFNWFYLSINVGWEWGFGIPAFAMVVAIIFFFGGSHLYRLQIPARSPLTRIFQVLVAASRKSNLQLPEDTSLLHESIDVESYINGRRKLHHTNNLKYLDKAAIVTSSDFKDFPNPWRLCTITQVEELKSLIHLLLVSASLIIIATVYHHFKIPPASLSLFDTVSVIILAPVCNLIIVPCARSFTGHEQGFSQLQRMGISFIILSITMIVSGILENIRLEIVRKNNYYDLKAIPMSILWQIPQFILVGCAQVFASIGQMEFFYGQAPDAMRSLGAALSLTTYAFGGLVGFMII